MGNILHTIKRKKRINKQITSCVEQPLQHVIEGKTEQTRRRGRKCKQLLDDVKGRGDTEI
jgi:hypothetical protein